jgi:hypothetical protein
MYWHRLLKGLVWKSDEKQKILQQINGMVSKAVLELGDRS